MAYFVKILEAEPYFIQVQNNCLNEGADAPDLIRAFRGSPGLGVNSTIAPNSQTCSRHSGAKFHNIPL